MDRLTSSFRNRKDRAVRKIKDRLKIPSRSTTPEPLTNAPNFENLLSNNPADAPSADSAFQLAPSLPNNSSPAPAVENPIESTASSNTTPALIITPAGPSAPQIALAGHPPTSALTLNTKPAPWTGLNVLAGVLDRASSGFAPLKSAVQAISGCVELYELADNSSAEYAILRNDLEMRFQDLAGFLSGPIPPTMTPSINNLANGITREINNIKQRDERTALGRYAQATKDADVIFQSYRRIETLLDRLVQNANVNIWKTIDEEATERRLNRLGNSPEARYNSADSFGRRNKCTPETRSAVISDMKSWAYHGAERMYWLNGMAGTGKTTIAYSLSEELQVDCRLAASFFCSRQVPSCRDVKLILPTISYQLARFSRPFRYALSPILEQHPDVHAQHFSEQFQALIATPLREVQNAMPEELVVVIDGVDECERQDAMDMVLGILLSEGSSLPIKFFVSSRPEPKIVNRMQSPKNNKAPLEFRLHELKHSTVRKDIETYLKTELDFMSLTAGDLETLTGQCGVLFIYAATAVRYIQADGPDRSPDRLKEVLEMTTASVSDEDNTVDSLYTAILGAAIDNRKLKETDRREMMLVFQSVICAQEPLTPAMLACLLDIRSERLVLAALAPLSSVLSVSTPDKLVTTLHASFSDYLFDKDRSGRFYCDRQMHHARFTHVCLNMMKTPAPPFNICGLESSFVFDRDVPELCKRIEKAISVELFYACRYWGSHLELAETSGALFSKLEEFFTVRFLMWMEVMNLKKSTAVGARIVAQVHSWCQRVACSKRLRDLIMDASRFVTMFSLSPASQSTPHIYMSVLASWPKEQAVSQCHSHKAAKLTKLTGTGISQPRSPLRAILTTTDPAVSIGCSPTGAYIVSGHVSGLIWIWDAYTGQRVGQPLEGHASGVLSVSYSPDGAHVVSGSSDRTIRIWNAHTGQIVGQPLEGHTGGVRSVSYSPNGSHIVSGSSDRTIRIWDAYIGQMVGQPLEGHTDWIWSVSYSLNGAHVVSGSNDRTIRIWDVRTGQMVCQPLKGHTRGVNSVSCSPDGVHLVSGSDDSTLRIWDIHTGQMVGQPLEGHARGVWSTSYSPDGAHIVSGSDDRTVRIWDVCTGQMVGQPLEGHTDGVRSVSYSSDGSHVVSGSSDSTIRIWDAHTRQIVDPLEGHTDWVYSVSYSPDGAHVVSGSDDRTVRIWDARTGQMVSQPLEGHTDGVYSVSYSPDGANIVSGSSDSTMRIWNAITGQMVCRPLEGHTDWIRSVSFSPDGTHVVSGSDDRTIRIWDACTGQMVGQPLEGHTDWVRSVSYSPDGVHIVSGSYDNTIRIWNAHTGQMVGQSLEGHADRVCSVSYSPDGAHLVSGSADSTIRIWNAHTGQMVGDPLKGHTGWVHSVSYSPDGIYMVSGSSDSTVRIWDTRTGQMVGQPLEGHTGTVWSASYSPDGTHVLSCSDDRTIRMWDTCTSQIVSQPFEGHTVGADSVSYLPDGAHLVSGSYDSMQRTWDIKTGQIISGVLENAPHSVPSALYTPDDPNIEPSPVHSPFPNPYHKWTLDDSGWVLSGSSEPLIWIPADLRPMLLKFRNTVLISKHGYVQLDFSNAALGPSWSEWYEPESLGFKTISG